MSVWRGVIDGYRAWLPVTASTPIVSLGEGATPLVRSNRLSDLTGLDVHLKYEGANPTGSFKDRGMTLAVSKALEAGSRAIVCASTGNTSASAAAYAGRAGISCAVLIPKGNVASGKLAQALVHGARVVEVEGNFDEALHITMKLERDYPITLVNSVNPFRIEGQKTAAFEVCDALGRAPDHHLIPVGNAGNITAYWKGYREYMDAGVSDSLPKMFGFQAAGSAPIVKGHPVERPRTIASAIRIGNPASWADAVAAAADSGGEIAPVSDREILVAYRGVASEGVFAEPSSCASIAGLMRIHEKLEPGSTVVCVLTGNGLKDPQWAISAAPPPFQVAPDVEQVASALGL